MNRSRVILISTLIVLIILLLLAFSLAFFFDFLNDNKAPYSAKNANPEGVKAIYRLYQQRGYQTKWWENPYKELPDTKNDLLMILNPQVKPPTNQEYDALKRWVAKGNHVVLVSSIHSDWTDRFRFQGVSCPDTLRKRTTPMKKDPWLQEVRTVFWPSGDCVLPKTGQTSLLVDEKYHSLFVKEKLGKGSIYYFPEASLLLNSEIDKEDHLFLLLAIAEWSSGTIWFDESVHPWPPSMEENPQENKSSVEEPQLDDSSPELPPIWTYIPFEGWLILLQLFLLVFLCLYAKGKRFAAPRMEWRKDKRNSMEFVDAIAKWYQRSGLRKEVLTQYQEKLNQDLYQALRLPTNAEKELVSSKIKEYLGRSYLQKYLAWQEQIDQLIQNRRISRSIFQQLMVESQRLREELEQWKMKIMRRK